MLARFGQLLRALADGPDPASLPAPSEVIATMEIGKMPIDWRYNAGIYSFAGYAVESAGAGARSQVGLVNPSGSGVVATLTHCEGYSTTTSIIVATHYGALADNDGAERSVDTRYFVGTIIAQRPACKVYSQTAAQQGDTVCRLSPDYDDGANYHYHHDQQYVLFPGTSVEFVPQSDNNSLVWSMWWHERRYDPEEIRGTRQGMFG